MFLIIKYNGSLKNSAKENKKFQTRQENHLWFDFLKDYPLRFRQQYIIGDYIADFYSRKIKLAIELDGSQHYSSENMIYDQKRTDFFNEQGIEVLRFSNYEVDNEFEGVCISIDNKVKEILNRGK